MTNRESTTRRTVLKAFAAGTVAGSAAMGSATAYQDELASRIDSDGHYATFPDDATLWQRSDIPLNLRKFETGGRWMVEPTSEGAVRMRVENDVPTGNVGFDLDVGRLGDVEAFTIDAETVETAEGDEATMWVGVYFDAEDTGDYFDWERLDEDTEAFAGFGDDTECLRAFPVDPDGVTVDRSSEWGALAVPADAAPADAVEKGWIVDDEVFDVALLPEGAGVTLEDYADGEVTIGGDTVDLGTDEDTTVALAVNCLAGGVGATEEVVVSDVTVASS